jgi:hypothetical protein
MDATLERLALTPRHSKHVRKPSVPLPAIYAGEQYINPRMPMRWYLKLGPLPGRAAFIAVLLWHWAVMGKRGAVVELRPGVVRAAGASCTTMYRALDTLEQAGLVQVDRKRGRSAVVAILNVASEEN